MIDPDALLAHARRLAGSDRGRPPEVDLRRGVSAAYYSVFHDITKRAAQHLIGAADTRAQNAIRRRWGHGEIAAASGLVVDRAKVFLHNPEADPAKPLRAYGPLPDLAASDGFLVAGLRRFGELQVLRHLADYDHEATFDKASLLEVCQRAELARNALDGAAAQARQAFFTILTVRRENFQER